MALPTRPEYEALLFLIISTLSQTSNITASQRLASRLTNPT
jgi:hypothetical protein